MMIAYSENIIACRIIIIAAKSLLHSHSAFERGIHSSKNQQSLRLSLISWQPQQRYQAASSLRTALCRTIFTLSCLEHLHGLTCGRQWLRINRNRILAVPEQARNPLAEGFL